MATNEYDKIINLCLIHVLLNYSQHSLINKKINDVLIISDNVMAQFTYDRAENMFSASYIICGKIIVDDGDILLFDASISSDTYINDLVFKCYSDNSLVYAPFIIEFFNNNKFNITSYNDYTFSKTIKKEIDCAYRLMMSQLLFRNNILYDYLNTSDFDYTLSDTFKYNQKRVLFLSSLLLSNINDSIVGCEEITDSTRFRCLSLLNKILYDFLEYSIDSNIVDSIVDDSINEVKDSINKEDSFNSVKNWFIKKKISNNSSMSREELKGILHVLSISLSKLSYDKEDLLGNNLPDYTNSININMINAVEDLYLYLIYPNLFNKSLKQISIKNTVRKLLK